MLQKHCSDAFMKQVLPRLHRPTNPSEDGHTSAEERLGFTVLGLDSAPLFCATLPRGHSSVLASRSSMKSRCPSTFAVQWSSADVSRNLKVPTNQPTNQLRVLKAKFVDFRRQHLQLVGRCVAVGGAAPGGDPHARLLQ